MKKIFYSLMAFIQMSFVTPDKPMVTADYLMGKFDPAKHADFCKIDAKYATKPDMYLRKEAYDAFTKMADAAQKEGIRLSVLSATRNFEYQKRIWDVKYDKLKDKTAWARVKKILQYSAMPGSSRHHWGTDIDLNNLENTHFEKGEGKKIYDWLVKNAATYGFCQPYTAGRKKGYKEEKWHWSYTPLSKEFTAIAGKYIKNEMIEGFKGAETAVQIDIVTNYILGINKECF